MRPALVSYYAFPLSNASESPEELILRPMLLPINGDYISFVVIAIWVLGVCLCIMALGAWLQNHHHKFITFLQARRQSPCALHPSHLTDTCSSAQGFDKHKHMKQVRRGPHKGEYKMVGSAIGGVLAIISYLFSVLGLIFVIVLLFNYDPIVMATHRGTACHLAGGETLHVADEDPAHVPHVDAHAQTGHEAEVMCTSVDHEGTDEDDDEGRTGTATPLRALHPCSRVSTCQASRVTRIGRCGF